VQEDERVLLIRVERGNLGTNLVPEVLQFQLSERLNAKAVVPGVEYPLPHGGAERADGPVARDKHIAPSIVDLCWVVLAVGGELPTPDHRYTVGAIPDPIERPRFFRTLSGLLPLWAVSQFRIYRILREPFQPTDLLVIRTRLRGNIDRFD
jgi:hypothetical protein